MLTGFIYHVVHDNWSTHHDERKGWKLAQGTAFFDQASAWLQSPAAFRAADNIIRRAGVPMTPQELCVNATTKVWEFTRKFPDRDVPHVQAYCRQIMNRDVIDCLRGRKRISDKPLDTGDDIQFDSYDGRKVGPVANPVVDTPFTDSSSYEKDPSVLSPMRACIEAVRHDPTPTSAALTFITLNAYEDHIDIGDLPKPERGADEEQALWWPCLHIAHQNPLLFPHEDSLDTKLKPAAQRQRLRRSRIVAEQVIDQAKFVFEHGLPS